MQTNLDNYLHIPANHFLVELNGTREADGFASQSLDARSERQVVTLGEYLLGQMYLICLGSKPRLYHHPFMPCYTV